jgi:hypothetical protein
MHKTGKKFILNQWKLLLLLSIIIKMKRIWDTEMLPPPKKKKRTPTRTHTRTHTHTHMLSTCTEKRYVNSSFKERSEPWQELCNDCWDTEHNYQGAQTWFLYNSHFALTFLWITVSQQLAHKNKFPIMTICHASWSKCLYTMYDCWPVQFLHRIQAAQFIGKSIIHYAIQ